MENTRVTMQMLRNALQSFGAEGKQFSNAHLCDAFGLQDEAEKNRMRTRIKDMVSSGEVERVSPGLFVYKFDYRPREARTYTVLWRFVRKSKPGWTLNECALMTRVSHTQISRYCTWLEEQGFIERMGKTQRNASIYRVLAKATLNPETPYPPLKETDPFARERAAAANITRLMLCADPYAAKTARNIVDACNTLLARFAKPVTQDENKENIPC